MEKVLRHTLTGRIIHWTNMVGITFLTLTGFYIHSPSRFNIFPSMDVARKIHFYLMFIVLFATIYRLYFAFATGDYKNLLFRPFQDLRNFPSMIKYYLFLSDSHPHYGKYNPGQRLVYSMWMVLILVQGATGLVLYRPDAFPAAQVFFGGLMMTRLIHYLITWIFVVTVMLHVYLDLTEGIDVLKSMVTGYIPVKQGQHAPGLPSQPGAVKSKVPKHESA